jgi:4-hydroxybenzoate polyprenyltransferase
MSNATFSTRLATLAADIKLGHTIFAMPFALLAACLATSAFDRSFLVKVILVVVCMVIARTFAMSMNRLLDANLDAQNPRTAGRSIPAGRLSRGFVLGVIVFCAIAFQAVTLLFGVMYQNWLPAILAEPALLFIGAYPLLKRFTQWCHYYLGAALGLAPVCAWIAIAGTVTWEPILLGLAVLCWTAGFDIIYACQDYESDLQTGVRSVPVRLGIGGALGLSRVTHVLSIVVFVALGIVSPQLHIAWFVGVTIAAGLLVYEHSLVKPTDLSKVNLAFFTLNGIIAIVLGVLGMMDCFV